MVLWVSIAIVTLVATALVVWPLVSSRHAVAIGAGDDERRRLAVFRDRKREIEGERIAGRLSDVEAAQAQTDLLQQLATDLPETAPGAGVDSGRGARSGAWLLAAVIAVLVPSIAISVYRQVGAPQFASAESRSADPIADPAQVEALIARIEQRTREHPDDAEAWAMLAEARKMQGRHADAVPAFEQALQRMPDDARLLTDFAESSALLAGGEFAGRPIELLERALSADPSEPKAIALMGAAQYRLGNLERARSHLEKLQTLLEPGSGEATQIGEILQRIGVELAQRAATGASGTGPSPGADSPLREASPPDALAARLSGTVTIAPALASQAAAGGTLYVVARQSGGPPLPIAVLRMPQAGFPAAFTLDESNLMDPSRRLSAIASLDLEARLSRSGNAMRQPGDLFGQIPGIRPGQSDLKIVIDRVVSP